MSHRALVAFHLGEDRYDVHYSHNGAEELQLEPVLQEHADDIEQRKEGFGQISSVPQIEKARALQDIEDSEFTVDVKENHDQAIESDPYAENVRLEQLAIDFADFEALYVVKHGHVETYIPCWIYPNVIRPWREIFTVEVFPSGRLNHRNPQEIHDQLDSMEPDSVINRETLEGNYLEDTLTSRIIKYEHENLFALAHMGIEEMKKHNVDDLSNQSFLLQTESNICRITITGDPKELPPVKGFGVYIDCDLTNYFDIEETVDHLRFGVGAGLNAVSTPPSDEDIADAYVDLLLEVYKEYRNQIADFSPEPQHTILQLLNTVIETTGTERYDEVAEAVRKRLTESPTNPIVQSIRQRKQKQQDRY